MEILESRIAPAAVFALDRSNHLLLFDSATPGTIVSSTPITGLPAGEHLVALTGGYPSPMSALGSSGEVYHLSYDASATPWRYLGDGALAGQHFGIATDTFGSEVTIASDAGEFAVQYYPQYPAFQHEPLQYDAGDLHAGAKLSLSALAYTDEPDFTYYYGIDTATDALVRMQNESVSTLGSLGRDAAGDAGLAFIDKTHAMASLTVAGVPALFNVDLGTGALTPLGTIGNGQTPIAGVFVPTVYQWTNASGDGLWSNARNWDVGAAPGDGARLVFPIAAAGASNNDLPAGTHFHGLAVAPGYTLSGQGIGLSGFLNVYNLGGPAQVGLDITLDGDLEIDGIVLQDPRPLNVFTGAWQLHGHTLTLSGSAEFRGAFRDDALRGAIEIISGPATFKGPTEDGLQVRTVSSTGLHLDGAGLARSSVTVNEGGNLDLEPSYLDGSGEVGSLLVGTNGTLSPGGTLHGASDGTIGAITVHDNFIADSRAHLQFDLGAPGGSDQLIVQGAVVLGDAELALSAPANVPDNTTFTLIDNRGSAAIDELAVFDGRMIFVNGQDFLLSTHGGDGNDFTATKLPPPHLVVAGRGDLDVDHTIGAYFDLTLSRPSAGPLTVHVATRDGTAFSVASGSPDPDYFRVDHDLTIPARTTHVSEYLTTIYRSAAAPDKEFYFDVTPVAGSSVTIDTPEVTQVIHAYGPYPILSTSGLVVEGDVASTKNITVRLDHSYGKDVTFTYSTVSGSAIAGVDFQSASGTLKIPAGSTSVVVPVTILGNTAHEKNRTFELQVQSTDVHTGPVSGTVTILDDDHAPIYTLQYRDQDGDVITLHDTRGQLNDGMMRVNSSGHLALNLTSDFWGSRFNNDSISVTATAAHGGNGSVDLKLVDANGVNLRSLTVDGDVGSIRAGDPLNHTVPAIGTLTVGSFGKVYATASSVPNSPITGDVTTVHVLGNVFGHLAITGNLQTLQIDGSLKGSADDKSGRVFVSGELHRGTIGGSIIGGAGEDSGIVSVGGKLGPLRVGGHVIGGTGRDSGRVTAGTITAVKIGGDLRAGGGTFSGEIYSPGSIGSVVIGGSMLLGGGTGAGRIAALGSITSVQVGHDIRMKTAGTHTGIFADATLGSVSVGGSIVGLPKATVEILGAGAAGGTTPAIGKLTVTGSVFYASIAAGFDHTNAPVNGSASIGSVTVHGNWLGTDLVAGIEAGADRLFGTADDSVIQPQGAALARIARIQVDGRLLDDPKWNATDYPSQRYAFTAQTIGAMILHGQRLALTTSSDELALNHSGNIVLREA